MGRPVKYPVDQLAVGESVTLPWHMTPTGEGDERRNKSMNTAVSNHARREGKVFRREPTAAGLRVTRLE